MVKRNLNTDGSLPDFSWLYKNPGSFRRSPVRYTRRCSWCEESFWVVNGDFRVCPTCDMCGGEE